MTDNKEKDLEQISKLEAKKLLSSIKSSMFKMKIYMPKRYSGKTSLFHPGGLEDVLRDK